MSSLRKLLRGDLEHGDCPVWAVHVGRGEIVWQDRCDAANGSKEPRVTDAARRTNDGFDQGQKTSRLIAWTYVKKKQRSLFANGARTVPGSIRSKNSCQVILRLLPRFHI